MGKLVVRLLAFAAVFYLVVEYAIPGVQRWWERRPVERELARPSADAWECVDRAQRASDQLGEAVRGLALRTGPAGWEAAAAGLRATIDDAHLVCGCPQTACRRAEQALAELEVVIADYDRMLTGERTAFANPAVGHDRALTFLDEARDALRE